MASYIGRRKFLATLGGAAAARLRQVAYVDDGKEREYTTRPRRRC